MLMSVAETVLRPLPGRVGCSLIVFGTPSGASRFADDVACVLGNMSSVFQALHLTGSDA